jgi:hypothetical protein
MLTLSEIHNLEIQEQYPRAIDELECFLQVDPRNSEIVTRLGFNLWLAVVEAERMGVQVPMDAYATRFVELLRQYEPIFPDNADFCWAFGLGIELFWFHFPGMSEEDGKALTTKARRLDTFWARFHDGSITQEELAQRLAGRGALAKYYDVGEYR